jgi:hypothetical protein
MNHHVMFNMEPLSKIKKTKRGRDLSLHEQVWKENSIRISGFTLISRDNIEDRRLHVAIREILIKQMRLSIHRVEWCWVGIRLGMVDRNKEMILSQGRRIHHRGDPMTKLISNKGIIKFKEKILRLEFFEVSDKEVGSLFKIRPF